ncbi:hypothetical protein [Pantoea stewartii]|uniref:hypothetical protein n=1 Tax=Pantoea stewartii TaxID=66269 RepID=UPI00197E6293|nr:hypothetical protein [Pantoea stewartii]
MSTSSLLKGVRHATLLFFQKGERVVVLDRSATNEAAQLIMQGFEKQFEEVSAMSEKKALARFTDIRRSEQADYDAFLAGAGTMPIIDSLRMTGACIAGKN